MKKVFAIAAVTMIVPCAFASLTLSGTVGEKSKSNKYSLKNISKYSQKSFSLSVLRNNLQYRGLLSIAQKNDSDNSGYNSFMQIEKGNTTYVMPFNFKVKVPKFKTPSPNN